ncbi:IS30 family transposase, partial [Enterococcus rivorum]|nr:IS30 family transposase [Enterococcus rivorum]
MTYTHLTPNELVMIEAYFKKGIVVLEAAKLLRRSRQTIY